MDFLYTIFTLIFISLLFLVLSFCFLINSIFIGKSINDPSYPPVKGTIFHQLFHFNKLYDYYIHFATVCPTFRMLVPQHSEIYTTEPRNIEHILKTNFSKYSKGEYEQEIMIDFFGHGIFAVNGEHWKQQRKLASFEFSTRVLRDFSCEVFRRNASRLVRAVTGFSASGRVFDMQVSRVLNYIGQFSFVFEL